MPLTSSSKSKASTGFGLRAVGQPRQHPGRREADIAAVVALPERVPLGVGRRAGDLGEIARVHQLLPALHVEERRRGGGDEGRVRRRRDIGHVAHQRDVARAVVEIVVADQAAEGLAAEHRVLFGVDLLEERALVPGRPLELLQGPPQLLLRDGQEADLQELVDFGVVDQVVQAAPRALDLLVIRMVQDQVDLGRQLAVDGGDHRLDGPDRIARDQPRVAEGLVDEHVDRATYLLLLLAVARPEGAVHESGEVVGPRRFGGRRAVLFEGLAVGHASSLALASAQPAASAAGAAAASAGFGPLARVCCNALSFRIWPMSCSALSFPSM